MARSPTSRLLTLSATRSRGRLSATLDKRQRVCKADHREGIATTAFSRFIFLAVLVFATAVIVAPSWGRMDTYWGHDNLTASNPPSGTCPDSVAGIACSGWNYWDESDAHWHSGGGVGYFTVGFICGSDGNLYGPLHGGPYETPSTYGAWWSTWCGSASHYNRVAVAHVPFNSSYNYMHAFWQIWP